MTDQSRPRPGRPQRPVQQPAEPAVAPAETPRRQTMPRLPIRHGSPVVWGAVLLCIAIEGILALSDMGFVGAPDWRSMAYRYGAFWNGLFEGWQPLFPGQIVTMFLTHAFLHSGGLHLVGNMVAVLALGGIVVARRGGSGFAVVFLLSAIAGAAAFALIGPDDNPMVGASGAVFGLIGAWKFWEYEVRRNWKLPMSPLWRMLAGLVVLNVILWVALGGLLAWEAHLGGFVAGWVWAALTTRHHRAAW